MSRYFFTKLLDLRECASILTYADAFAYWLSPSMKLKLQLLGFLRIGLHLQQLIEYVIANVQRN